MIFKHLLVLITLPAFLIGCSVKGTNQLSSENKNTYSYFSDYTNQNTSRSDSNFNEELIKTPVFSHNFNTFDSLKNYLLNDFKTTNDESFCLIFPDMLSPYMGKKFSVGFDSNNENGKLINPKIYEMFYIYDETIGNMADETKDIPYYTAKIDCIFYPVTTFNTDLNVEIERITDEKTKMTISKDYALFGIVYLTSSFKMSDNYLASYFFKNYLFSNE